jgi:hypothetical protein
MTDDLYYTALEENMNRRRKLLFLLRMLNPITQNRARLPHANEVSVTLDENKMRWRPEQINFFITEQTETNPVKTIVYKNPFYKYQNVSDPYSWKLTDRPQIVFDRVTPNLFVVRPKQIIVDNNLALNAQYNLDLGTAAGIENIAIL